MSALTRYYNRLALEYRQLVQGGFDDHPTGFRPHVLVDGSQGDHARPYVQDYHHDGHGNPLEAALADLPRIGFLGDSVASATQANAGQPDQMVAGRYQQHQFIDSFPVAVAAQLSAECGQPVLAHILAVPGATSKQLLTQQLPQLTKIQRISAVVVSVGANDVKEGVPLHQLVKNLHTLYSALREKGTKTYLIPMLNLALAPRFSGRIARLARRLSAVVAAIETNIAHQYGGRVLTRSLTPAPIDFMDDRIHPGKLSQQALAAAVTRLMLEPATQLPGSTREWVRPLGVPEHLRRWRLHTQAKMAHGVQSETKRVLVLPRIFGIY